MSDDADLADIQQQRLLDAAIKNAVNKPLEINGNGNCLSCGCSVLPVYLQDKIIIPRWCSIECRDIWDMDV